MAEYIEREAALEAVTVWYKKSCQPENMSSYNMGERDAYTTAISEIIELPAADVQPVRKGQWEGRKTFFHNRIVKCSLCGNFLDLAGVNAGRGDANFCPNCGADMRPRPKEGSL